MKNDGELALLFEVYSIKNLTTQKWSIKMNLFVIVMSLLSKCDICLLNIPCNFTIPIFMQQIFLFLLNNSLNFYQNEISSYR